MAQSFFEKLTGSKTKPLEPADWNPKEIAYRPTQKQTLAEEPEPRLRQVKIATEDTNISPAEPEASDEEGELTVDIYDRGDAIVILSTVAGVKPEDLDVSITNDTVSIRGKRECQDAIDEKNYYYKELFWGTFARSVILPEEIEEDEAEAILKHGLLTLRLPKKKRGVMQKLKVKVS